MKFMKRLLSMFLVVAMVLGLMPATAIAKGTARTTDESVYLSISFDGKYIDDKDGNPIVYLPISLDTIASVDLTEYGLEHMLYDADGDGDYETTALQLLIYAHEELYGGDWSEVTFDALPGSSYFRGGIFGFTENLVYFHNGDFPVDESQQSDFMTVGATSDRIVLEAGDFLDVASFECYSFLWDQLGGFHLFADENDNYVHDYTAEVGETMSIKLKHSFCDLMYGQSWIKEAADFEVYYGSAFGDAEGSVTTDDNGDAEIIFSNAGTYYVWCDGGIGSDDGTHGACDHYMETYEPCIVSAPAYVKVTVTGGESTEQPVIPEQPESTRQPQDVSTVLKATMGQLATTVKEPAFGTDAGEWTVFGLARGNHFKKNDTYFKDYYDRIAKTVNETAASVNLNGALDKSKSTDNSRLIVALSAIGKDATSVGNWDLVEPYSANGINWIKKQGMNGTIWTLIALDSNNYKTSDPTIRHQCVDAIVSAQHNDGGWSLVTAKDQPSNVDITAMALTALYPYRNQDAVASACETARAWLSASQLENGGFPYGQGETSESCAWAIVAAATWGINPDTDPRFVKNGNSAVDNLLTYYVEEEAMFEHGKGAGSNAMATDQATYALVAYDRFINDETSLFDYSDVDFDDSEKTETPSEPELPKFPETDEMAVVLGLPAKTNPGSSFNGIISINQWDNEAGYKLMDLIVNIPDGVTVTDVSAGDNLEGGEVTWYHEEDTGKLRIVYFDASENSDLTMTGNSFPATLMTIGFKVDKDINVNELEFSISGMSLKKSSDSLDENSMLVVNSSAGQGSVDVIFGISFSAVCLYEGDDVDLIPSTKKAIVLTVTGLDEEDANVALRYDDGKNDVEFKFSTEISEKTGVSSYIALVDSGISMKKFINADYYELDEDDASDELVFGDSNGDGEINAQDALNAVNYWLRKEKPTDDEDILAVNVNGDSRLNTFDALGIVEAFVHGTEYGVVTKAATITTKRK